MASTSFAKSPSRSPSENFSNCKILDDWIWCEFIDFILNEQYDANLFLSAGKRSVIAEHV